MSFYSPLHDVVGITQLLAVIACCAMFVRITTGRRYLRAPGSRRFTADPSRIGIIHLVPLASVMVGWPWYVWLLLRGSDALDGKHRSDDYAHAELMSNSHTPAWYIATGIALLLTLALLPWALGRASHVMRMAVVSFADTTMAYRSGTRRIRSLRSELTRSGRADLLSALRPHLRAAHRASLWSLVPVNLVRSNHVGTYLHRVDQVLVQVRRSDLH